METNLIYIFLGFIEGFCLILSPCILPVLPLFLAGSLSGSKKRPVGIIMGFILFFTVLVFFSRQLVSYLGFNFNLFRDVGYTVLCFLGIIMLSDYLTEKFRQITQGLTRLGSFFSSQNHGQTGFWNGIFFGGILAIVWTPCAGPILAAIIVQTVLQQTTLLSFFILLAFATGAALPMFIISLYGKKLIATFSFLKLHLTQTRKVLGAVIIASVVYMAYFEGRVLSSTVTPTGIKTSTSLIDGLWHPYPAPELEGIHDWINSPPLHMSELKGKVVLIDFWTYSCINCIRTLPYLKNWYARFHDKGLVIIGVHTPEFDFEKNLYNVKAAVQSDGILYPVALDNQFVTWINFNNHFWPAHYLINQEGKVVYQHFGEGDYDVTENNIRFLLGIHELEKIKMPKTKSVLFSQTPETYLGYQRADVDLSPVIKKDQTSKYHFAKQLILNAWNLQGLWQVNADSITAMEAGAALKIHFNACKVFLVMGNSSNKPITVKVLVNQVKKNDIVVNKYSLYEAVSLDNFSSAYLEIISTAPGLKVYTLTFGN